jgi:hypothetical protein
VTTLTTERLEEILAALPPTADETAALFEELGIKGVAADACNCPMANYLKGEIALAPYAHLSFFSNATVRPNGFYDDSVIRVEAPEHLYEFARAFDRGHYPELKAE